MYVIRRSWRAKPYAARQVATIVADIAQAYIQAGQRSETRVYFNGATLPGERNIVCMEWEAASIESPYRGSVRPPDIGTLRERLRDLTEESWIEFFELMTPEKADSPKYSQPVSAPENKDE